MNPDELSLNAMTINPKSIDLRQHEERVRSDSLSSTGSYGKFVLRQRVAQLMTCMEDVSSDEDLHEELSRSIDQAFLICGRKMVPKTLDFRLHLVTWNVATASPPRDVRSLLQLDIPGSDIDMYIIGLQEVNSKVLNFLSDLAFDDPWSIYLMDILAPHGYVKLSSIRLQGLLLLTFVKHQHIPFVQDIRTNYIRTGLFGYWGNKGGVTVRMSVYGHMVCFMNCHLPAHMENTNQRLDDFERMLDTQQFDDDNTGNILDHDLVFCFGDLNFRITDFGIHFIREAINSNKYNLLWEKDQLNIAKKKEQFLQGFLEGPLKFKPTYKFDQNSDVYDTSSKKRKPAWTDRILWKLKDVSGSDPGETTGSDFEEFLKVSLDKYTSHMSYGISDHKPVTGTFTLQLKPLILTPSVTLKPEGEWNADHDSLISYSVAKDFPSSTWDWIGLYRVGFRHTNDYVTYAWVKDDEISFSEDCNQVYMNADDIPLDGGEFLLCYHCHNLQCLAGISQPFQIRPGRNLGLKEEENRESPFKTESPMGPDF
ncbi:inositol polyphosphate 5-phosphatase K isoform X2 [Xenopus laevis]|uniref:Inositol polyphosphate 5-phosphatase K isoform X2 n=1 Tax=Xenopus laevis TaxID=8355 RepID=A0A8J0UCY2_XENLA|nr:inositol polyphosphate 5-phosphatase K isoform X2 [Xenopus laevis]